MKFADGKSPSITGGPLKDSTYIFHSFHFHWGGSEHRFNNIKYTAELHVVHYNSKYNSFTTALSHPDGLSVLGFILVETSLILRQLKLPFFQSLSHVVEPHSNFGDTNNIISYLDLIGENKFIVASYPGSLTAEPFSESVTWMVSTTLIGIRREEVKMLKSLKNEQKQFILANARELQAINGRKVIFYRP